MQSANGYDLDLHAANTNKYVVFLFQKEICQLQLSQGGFQAHVVAVCSPPRTDQLASGQHTAPAAIPLHLLGAGEPSVASDHHARFVSDRACVSSRKAKNQSLGIFQNPEELPIYHFSVEFLASPRHCCFAQNDIDLSTLLEKVLD